MDEYFTAYVRAAYNACIDCELCTGVKDISNNFSIATGRTLTLTIDTDANNKFYIETSKNSKKTENLNRNKMIYYCVDDPNPPYKGFRGREKSKFMKTSITIYL
jgi:hypothetical protein